MYNKFLGSRNFEKDADRLIVELSESFGPAYTLVDAVIATDTLITLNKNIPNIGANNTFVVIDPFTTECEIRKVTAVTGNTYTIDALTYGHAAGDPVLYTEFPYCNVKWFGAVGDGATDDLIPINRATTAAGAVSGAAMIVEFPPGVYLVSDTVNIPNKVIVRGAGPIARLGPPGSTIQAKSTFAAATPLIWLGDDASNSVYCRLENIGVDGNHYADIGVYSNSINEESGLMLCTITDCDTYGIFMDNTVSDLCRNYLLQDIYVATDSATAAIGIYINGGASVQRGIDGCTVDMTDGNIGLKLDSVKGAVFERLHFEGAVDGIKIGATTECYACTFIGITGGPDLTDMIHIDNATTSTHLSFLGCWKKTATNNINDVLNGNLITATYLNYYSTSDLRAVGDIYTVTDTDYFSTSTIVGWSAYTTSILRYKKVGSLVFVQFDIRGTSDNATTTFTLPFTTSTGWTVNKLIRIADSGTFPTTPGLAQLSGTTVTCYKDANTTAFTASGTKVIQGEFFYETT